MDYEKEEVKHILSGSYPRVEKVFVAVEETQKILQTKMDLFTRLQQFHDTLQAIKQENNLWNSITSQQVDKVLARLEELLALAEKEYAPDATALCSQIESVHASFVQLECDRIKEKLRILLSQLDKLVNLMAKRKILILKFKEFLKFVTNAEDKLLSTVHETSIGAEVDVQRITNEMSAVLSRINEFGAELAECELQANMTITGTSVVDAVNRIKDIPLIIGPIEKSLEFSKLFQEFFEVSNQLESVFLTDIRTCEHLDNAAEFIAVSLENGKKETELMNRLTAIVSDLKADEHSKANEILSKLKPFMEKRQEVRRVTVEDCVGRSLVILTQKEQQLETVIEHDIVKGSFEAFQNNIITQWIPWKEELDRLILLIENSNSRWREAVDELIEKARNFDLRIANIECKLGDFGREQNILAFVEWLDLAEEDVNRIQTLRAEKEGREKMAEIHKVCLSYQTLVNELLNSRLDSPHSNEVKRQCNRYFTLLDRINMWDFREQEKSADLDLLSSSVHSEFPISSFSCSENERGDTETTEISKDLFEETNSTRNLAQRILKAKEEKEIQQLLTDTDEELNFLADFLSSLSGDYARSLKPLINAQRDLKKLQELNERRRQLNISCNTVSNLSDENLAVVRSLTLHLQSLEEPYTIFIQELQKEIDDEVLLRTNYDAIVQELNHLNANIDYRAQSVIQDLRNKLERVQSQMDFIRSQCLVRRKYVENIVENVSPRASPGHNSRRKKIVLMISRTVTTIIQVVEDELRQSSQIPENELMELRQKLQDVNTCIKDEDIGPALEDSNKILIDCKLAAIEKQLTVAEQLMSFKEELIEESNVQQIEMKSANIRKEEEILNMKIEELSRVDT
ncbi:unnamed protein product, partial [Thelazia callipaeda]|uniref:Titin n=1 Tax=Thelazia callipaeda TaxID=103827 RepID=A0A158RCE7_THECL